MRHLKGDRTRKNRKHGRGDTKKWEWMQLRMRVGLLNQSPASVGPRSAELVVCAQRWIVRKTKWKRENEKCEKGKDESQSLQVETVRVDMERKLRREAAEIEAGVDGWDAERSKSEKRKSRKSKEKRDRKRNPLAPTLFGCWNI